MILNPISGGEPWWRTPWLVVPVWAAATVAGVAIAELRTRRHFPPRVPPSPHCPPTFGPNGGVLGGVEYIEVRSGGAGADDLLPLLVVLHGRDSTPAEIAAIAGGIPVPARIVAPSGFLPDDAAITPRRWLDADPADAAAYATELGDVAAGLDLFVGQVTRCRPTMGAPVVAGYDQGASVAYTIAADVPDRVGTAIGAAGRLLDAFGPVRVSTVVIHGRLDRAVPFAPVSATAATMVAAGAPLRLVPMTAVRHSFAGALQIKWLQEIAAAVAAERPAISRPIPAPETHPGTIPP